MTLLALDTQGLDSDIAAAQRQARIDLAAAHRIPSCTISMKAFSTIYIGRGPAGPTATTRSRSVCIGPR